VDQRETSLTVVLLQAVHATKAQIPQRLNEILSGIAREDLREFQVGEVLQRKVWQRCMQQDTKSQFSAL
jgi:hypothetical protein